MLALAQRNAVQDFVLKKNLNLRSNYRTQINLVWFLKQQYFPRYPRGD